MMEKETGIVDVVKDSSSATNDSIQIVVKEERVVDQTLIDDNKLTAESKKESPVVVVEEVTDVENIEESAEKGKDDESSEKEPTEMVSKECVEEVNVESFDEEVKEDIYAETAEKEDVKIVDVSQSTDEAGGKHEDEIKDAEPVSADFKTKTADVKILEAESKPEASEAKESASEVEVKAEENSETEEEAELQVKLEEKTVETKCPEEVVLISQDLVSEPKKESEEVAYSSPTDFIEKMSDEAKHVVEEDEGIKEDALKQTDIESKEEMITEKAAEGLQTEPADVKESGEAKQESEVTEKEFDVKPKHSNNILSKVKQSLVKAKKAITGK